ncbi:hypothetical protein RPMD05_54 [Rhodobacteraceae phage LS06-2018-MD05]|nr:hypothetical protein RPMD05_54 [Rhodobacteraceae phage LS06-2018-MD05]
MRNIDVKTNFDVFWLNFHIQTKQPKLSNKKQAEIEWNRCVIKQKKIDIIESIKPPFKTKLNALQYIRQKLN